MAKALEAKLRYVPRPLQMYIHQNFKRFNFLVLHRRFGKSKCAIAQMLHMGLTNPLPDPRYIYVAPTYKMAKNIAWDEMKKMVKDIPGVSTNEQELKMTIQRQNDKVMFNLFSGDNYEAILGIYADGAIFDEWQNQNPLVYSRIVRPLLADRLGWAMFLGTPRGNNHFKEDYERGRLDPTWFTFLCGNKDSKLISDDEMKSLVTGMSEEEIAQEFQCSFIAPNSGTYYARIIAELREKGQITKVPHETAAQVYTAWDLGMSDSTAIWFFQQIGSALHIIDYLEDSGRGLEYYVRKLREGHRASYLYAEHILPHDAKARELGTGKSREEILRTLGLDRIQILPISSLEDGIYNTRSTLPRCWFDDAKCFNGLLALESYQKVYDEKKRSFGVRPRHDWSSHAADAFRYLSLGAKNPSRRSQNNNLQRSADSTYDIYNYATEGE